MIVGTDTKQIRILLTVGTMDDTEGVLFGLLEGDRLGLCVGCVMNDDVTRETEKNTYHV